jgi:hypothetical protein
MFLCFDFPSASVLQFEASGGSASAGRCFLSVSRKRPPIGAVTLYRGCRTYVAQLDAKSCQSPFIVKDAQISQPSPVHPATLGASLGICLSNAPAPPSEMASARWPRPAMNATEQRTVLEVIGDFTGTMQCFGEEILHPFVGSQRVAIRSATPDTSSIPGQMTTLKCRRSGRSRLP